MKQAISILSLLVVFYTAGQNNTISFINYNVENGLCDNQVSTIAQDSRGFIWIGTQGGFNRFDGFGFKKFFPTELANNHQITDNTQLYFESKPNVLLVRLGNSKAYTFNTISQEMKEVKSLNHLAAYDFIRFEPNVIAVAGLKEAYLLDNELKIKSILHPPFEKKDVAVYIRKMSSNSYLVYSSNEFFQYNTITKNYRRIPIKINLIEEYNSGYLCLFVDETRRHIFLNNYFTGLYKVDYNGNVVSTWLHGTNSNKITLNPQKIIPIPSNKNYVWVAGGKGVSRLNLETNATDNFTSELSNSFSLPADYVSNLFLDKNENLWACTFQGISRQNRYQEKIRTWDLGTTFENPLMNLIKSKEGAIYTAAYFGNLFKINNSSPVFEKIEPIKLNGSWFVFEDNDFLIQGGEGTKIRFYNKVNGKVTESSILAPYFQKSTLIVLGHKSKKGDLWFSGNAGGGLVRIKNKTGKIQHFSKTNGSFSDSYFTICKEDMNGDLWFSSNKSQKLLHWKSKTETFEEIDFELKFNKLNYFQSGINYHAIDKNGNIWIGFDGTGLVKYNVDSEKIDLYTKQQGLPHNIIFNLIFDHKNRLWIGTKKGLACLNLTEKTIYNFNVSNGFPTESFETSCSYFDLDKKELWIASNELLLCFKLDKILSGKSDNIEIFIDELLVNNINRYQSNISHYQFSPKENNLQISFNALNFHRNNEVIFSYKLDGASEQWVECGNNKNTSIVNLRSGEYDFQLRAKLAGESKWTYLSKPIHFTIQTPWYLSWWFISLMGIVTIFIIYVLIRSYFVRKIEQQKSKIEQQKAVQNERDRIAYDMHDDLGSGLTKISYLSQMAIAKTQQSEELSKINKTSLELVENMSELIWAMKGENDSLQDLITYLKLYAVEYLEFNAIELNLVFPQNLIDKPISGESRRNIFLLFKEALHNVVKHANASKVEIEVSLSDNFILIISDNGIGFEPIFPQNSPRNGLRNMGKRTENLKGTFEIENRNGTVLTFIFPFSTL